MHCWKCGAEINPGSNFCQNCGEKTGAVSSLSPEPAKAKPWFTLLFLLLVGLIIVSIYFLLNKEDLDKVITHEIAALKDKHYTEAYYEYTSKDFQTTTPLEVFREFVKNNPIFGENTSVRFISSRVEDNIGFVKAILTAKNGSKGEVVFHLVKDGGKWKIQYVQIEDDAKKATTNETLNDAPKELTPAHSTDKKKLTFNKILLGNTINQEGAIDEPAVHFSPHAGAIYANVFVENSQPGDNINVVIKHLDTDDQTPPVTLPIDQAGNSTEVLFFNPPADRWPEGEYALEARSSAGASIQIPFQVKHKQDEH